MPFRTPGSDPSSSSRLQSTPALQQSRLRGPHASSSSSPSTDSIQTPRDEYKIEAAGHGRNMKGKGRDMTRRSVRVRESSGGNSPPGVFTQDIIVDSPEMEIASTYHSQPQPDFTVLATSQVGSSTLARSRSRPALPPRPNPSHTLALAQAHGITKVQFEEAKQQVMRFLQTDNLAPLSPTAEESKGKSNSAPLSRSVSFVATSTKPTISPASTSRHASPGPSTTPAKNHRHAASPVSALPSVASPGDQSNPIGDASVTPSNPSIQVVRGRASLDNFAGVEKSGEKKRREEDLRKEREMQLWVEDGQGESSSEEQHEMVATSQNPTRTPRAVLKVSRSNSLPHQNPSSRAASPSLLSPAQPLISGGQPGSLAKRGMMERFMTDRAGNKDEEEVNSNFTQHRAAPNLTSADSSPRRPSQFSPGTMMTSPINSNRQAGLLLSPDVARLLRSELDELQASGSSTQRSSPRKRIHSATGIVSFPPLRPLH